MARADRTNEAPFLLPTFPRHIYRTLRERGMTNEAIFADLDFSAAQLEDERFRLSIDQHERFMLRVLELTGDAHFALEIADLYDPARAGVPLLAAMNGATIAEALRLVARYDKLITRTFTVVPPQSDDDPTMVIEPRVKDARVLYFAVGAFALMFDRVLASSVDGKPLVEAVEMSMAEPADFDAVRARFGFPVTFNHERCRIRFRPEVLGRRTRQADPTTVRLLREMSERQLEEAEAEAGIAGALAALLLADIARPPGLDEAARRLGLSPRGLRRKLQESGTTYQQVLDDLRRRLATRLLQESEEPVYAIGYRLGFENPSDFGRAFRRWTGESPSAVRARRRA
jgi:AraC-like DNA-binding protein